MSTQTEPTSLLAHATSAPLAIFYEHPRWFEPLFAELERRGVGFARLHSGDHWYAIDEAFPHRVVFNRMSPSAYRRDETAGILYTGHWLGHLESLGVRVINGSKAFRYEVSKALQYSLLRELGLPYPKSRVIQHPAQALDAAIGLRYPIIVKPNVGGSGAGVTRFDSPAQLGEAVRAGSLDMGLDRVAIVQEFIPARGGHITRVEVCGSQYLYGIRVHLSGETFDLCPADICRTSDGTALETSCVVEAPKQGLKVEGYEPPLAVRADVERMMHAAGIEVGGVEYLVDDRDGQLYYYDVNALSNFVSDGHRVVGFDPFVKLVDFLEREAA